MINCLTKKQEDLLNVYKNKWLNIGLSTERINRKKATENFLLFNKMILNNRKKIPVLFFDSPLSAWIAILLLKEKQIKHQIQNQVRNQVENQVRNQVQNQMQNQVRNQMQNQVRNQVENQVRSQMWNQMQNQVRSQVGDQMENQVENQVRNQVENQVKNQVRSQVGDQMESFIYPYLCGNFDSAYFSFYDFIYDNLITISSNLIEKWNLYKLTSKVNLIYPFDDFCIISEKPTKINMKNNVLHNETGASIEYVDELSVYSLNGIQVPKEIVMTSWDKLDSKLILTENNAEVRREIVRKIGIEKICKDLNAKTIDRQEDYELLILDTGDQQRQRPYLKMKNPSIGCYHIEGVPPGCDTVEKALNSRKPSEMKKIPINDVNGEDWYQQGDVCIWQENAKSLKSKPKILT